MTRSEVVVLWRTVHQEEGLRVLWHSLWERYFLAGLGELHDPEFLACLECGREFELAWNGQSRAGLLQSREFCRGCTDLARWRVANLKRRMPQLVRDNSEEVAA